MGHKGHTLKQVAHISSNIVHPRTVPPASIRWGMVVETRQVFDIPPMHFEVTEHQVLETRCRCGHACRSTFPDDVSAPVQRPHQSRGRPSDTPPHDADCAHRFVDGGFVRSTVIRGHRAGRCR